MSVFWLVFCVCLCGSRHEIQGLKHSRQISTVYYTPIPEHPITEQEEGMDEEVNKEEDLNDNDGLEVKGKTK